MPKVAASAVDLFSIHLGVWGEESMQTETMGRDAVMMLSHRSVRHIEDRSDALAKGLLHKLQHSARAEAFCKVPPDELTERVSEIYRHLGEWLLDKSEADIEQRYTQIGARRAQQGVPNDHFKPFHSQKFADRRCLFAALTSRAGFAGRGRGLYCLVRFR